ncbi:MAG TPA: 50S ribosomal protein L32 [Candidatus Hydrogenedentes bacterium]|nr:50S ribosomal protein L32 [Candidatus Hydrogenedentota bacterium]HOL76461.1 50S ribosomal protein L32 [Candidatus Hydrogenedentota bacterium]HPO85501.1 50S ribosomal protein L32 [Candidatus Hydrogenedentota bacterium]
MPVPKRRTGKARRNMRRSHHALHAPGLTECQSCGERIPPHRVCPKCGHYKDRLVVTVEKD